MLEYKINNYITLKLEYGKTQIYLLGERFIQCKFLLMDIPAEEINSFDEIDSIDEVEEILDHSLETQPKLEYNIDPSSEFWAHCSNLQVWSEENYNTNLLHKNLAFPLLKKLTEGGDVKAKHVFKEEIVKRMRSGSLRVALFLLKEKYLEYLNQEELELSYYYQNRYLREKIEEILKKRRWDSSHKIALLVLKELAELGDDMAKRRSIEEFQNERERKNLSSYDLMIKDGYRTDVKWTSFYEYLDRATMMGMLLERGEAKTMLALDNIISNRLLEVNSKREPKPLRGRVSATLRPTYLIGEIDEEIGNYTFLIENKRVVELNLNANSDFKLLGFPEPILKLTALRKLNLSFNNIQKIPVDISSLKELSILILNWCNIHSLPESIGELRLLEKLDLKSNSIGDLPNSIGELRSLKELNLNINNLKTLPKKIGNLKSLIHLSLYANKLRSLPDSLMKLNSLVYLNIAHNKLAAIPEKILQLKSIHSIYIDGTQEKLFLHDEKNKKKKRINIRILE